MSATRMLPCRYCGAPVISERKRGRPRTDCGKHPQSAARRHTREGYATQRTRKPERDAAVIAAWQAGESGTAVGKRFGVTREYVRQILLRNGIGSMLHRKVRVKTCSVCGVAYDGPSAAHVRAALHDSPNAHRMPRGATAETAAMAAAYRDGGDAREIASRYGVSPITVYRAGNVEGYTRYRQGGRVGPRTPERRQAVSMLRQGDPAWLVSEMTGVDRDAIYYLRRRYGL